MATATSLEKLPSAAFYLPSSPCLPILSLCHLANALPRSIASRPTFGRVSSRVRSYFVPRSLTSIGTVTKSPTCHQFLFG